MKYKALLLTLVSAAIVVAETIYVPENAPITFQWDHDRRFSSPATYYNLYLGTNLVSKITTNNFTIQSVSNGVSTVQGSVTFPHQWVGPDATNQLSITALDPVSNLESDRTTNVLLLQVVGKPLPPSDSRKP